MSASLAAGGVGAAVTGQSDEITRMTTRATDIISVLLDYEVQPDDNFFDLGGTALDAVLAGSQLSAEFGVTLPLAVVFKNPTVAELVAVVCAHRGIAPDGERSSR